MGYGVLQSYGFSLVFPANGIGGHQKSWVIRVYGFPKRWVMTELTVPPFSLVNTFSIIPIISVYKPTCLKSILQFVIE